MFESMWLVWLILAGFFFVGEIVTAGFLVFWLGIGSLIAMVSSFFIENVYIQVAIFAVFSIVLIVLTKPLVRKFLDKETISTNSYSLIGKKGIVTENINPIESKGQVKVNGEIWSAKSENDEPILKDTEVEILEITGVKLVVRPCKRKANI